MDTKFNKTQDTVLNGIVRHILTAAGGALVTKGYFADTELELAVGAIITLAGVIWSAFAKRKAKGAPNCWPRWLQSRRLLTHWIG